jgi:hypothetical protein
MQIINTSWRCQQCGGTFLCDPPEHRLCDQCLARLAALARTCSPHTATCSSCGGPLCPDCGQAMTVLLTVTVPAPNPAAGQIDLLVTAYGAHCPGVTGNDT